MTLREVIVNRVGILRDTVDLDLLISDIKALVPEKKSIKPYDTNDQNAWMYPPYNTAIDDTQKALGG